MLCPAHWCSAGGALLIMSSARPLSRAEQESLLASDGFPDWDYMPGEDSELFEYKASDWGWFKGRLVALEGWALRKLTLIFNLENPRASGLGRFACL
jgi:hypothetical protein